MWKKMDMIIWILNRGSYIVDIFAKAFPELNWKRKRMEGVVDMDSEIKLNRRFSIFCMINLLQHIINYNTLSLIRKGYIIVCILWIE